MADHQKYTAFRKLTDNRFLNLYEMDALTRTGKSFHYYFASREPEDRIKLNTHSNRASGMAVFAVTKESPHRLVMIRQYRYPMDEYLYELPAGLIEEGETDAKAAVREMKEETGLDLTVYEGGNPDFRRPFYLAQGLSDELDSMVFGYASGSVDRKQMEDSEDIEVCFVDKKEALRILHEEKLSIRAGYLLIQFLQLNEKEPFSFLNITNET